MSFASESTVPFGVMSIAPYGSIFMALAKAAQ